MAVWYAGDADQEYMAYGWVAEVPQKPASQKTKYYGPVACVKLLPGGRSRQAGGCSAPRAELTLPLPQG